MAKREVNNERGAALLEVAVTLPLILLISVAIFEFGRAYQTWQVMTNAAREGARIAILAEADDAAITKAVSDYLKAGSLEYAADAGIKIERTVPFGEKTASRITVSYPFKFMVLNPVMQLVKQGSATGQGTTMMEAQALMRNES